MAESSDTLKKIEVRLSRRARRRRIEVRSDGVTVVGPVGDSPGALRRLARRKRKWILRRQDELRRREERLQRLISYRPVQGCQLPFRGRRLPISIRVCDGPARAEMAEGLVVHAPRGASEDELRAVIDGWLAERLLEEGQRLVRVYARRLGVPPAPVRVRDMRTRWGSLGSTGRLTLNLRLAHLPAWTWEHVTAHELCHCRIRNHSAEFYRLLWSVLPEEIPRVRRLERALGA